MRRFLTDFALALAGVIAPPVIVLAVAVEIVKLILWLMK